MSEKRRPHHGLHAIKSTFSSAGRLRITGSATRDSVALGYSSADVVRVIRSIQPAHFYKSMTSDRDAHVWQDVYHVPDGSTVLYVKFTDNGGSGLLLLSFKAK